MKKQLILFFLLLSTALSLKAISLDTIDAAVRIDLDLSICQGTVSDPGGYSEGGVYVDTLLVNGQCTIRTIELAILPTEVLPMDTICVEQFDFPTGPSSTTGVFTSAVIGENGCTAVQVTVAFLKPDDIFNYITPCSGIIYELPDGTLVSNDTTIIREQFFGVCSFNEFFTFEFKEKPVQQEETTICANDTLVWNGVEITEPGTYFSTTMYSDSTICDAVVNELIVSLDSAENCTGTVSVADSFVPELRIYPNPANDFLNIFTEGNIIDTQLEILDASGQRLIKATVQKNRKTIDISELDLGIYFLKVVDKEHRIQTQSFVKI